MNSTTYLVLAAGVLLASVPDFDTGPETEPEPHLIHVGTQDAGGSPSPIDDRRATLLKAMLAPKADGGFPMLEVTVMFQGTENPDTDSAVMVIRNKENGAMNAQVFIWRQGATRWTPIPEAYR